MKVRYFIVICCAPPSALHHLIPITITLQSLIDLYDNNASGKECGAMSKVVRIAKGKWKCTKIVTVVFVSRPSISNSFAISIIYRFVYYHEDEKNISALDEGAERGIWGSTHSWIKLKRVGQIIYLCTGSCGSMIFEGGVVGIRRTPHLHDNQLLLVVSGNKCAIYWAIIIHRTNKNRRAIE